MAGTNGAKSWTGWTPPRDRPRWRKADAVGMVEALAASGEDVETFAQRHGLQPARVRRWAARIREEGRGRGDAVSFSPVRLVPGLAQETGAVEIVVGEAVVRVRRGFDEDVLRRVVTALGGQSC